MRNPFNRWDVVEAPELIESETNPNVSYEYQTATYTHRDFPIKFKTVYPTRRLGRLVAKGIKKTLVKTYLAKVRRGEDVFDEFDLTKEPEGRPEVEVDWDYVDAWLESDEYKELVEDEALHSQ